MSCTFTLHHETSRTTTRRTMRAQRVCHRPRPETMRALRALNAHADGATADVLAPCLNVGEGAVRRLMVRAAASRLVRVEALEGVDRRCSTPRLRYHIAPEGMKWIHYNPSALRSEQVQHFAARIPNSVFSLATSSLCA